MGWVKDKVFANADDFLVWLDQNFGTYISSHISENHVHHTLIPNHSFYPEHTTLELHKGMRNTHINSRGWDDIGQHITIGKDGDIVTGRDIQKSPASATGYNGNSNSHPFMYEMVGNFDKGNDKLEGKQLDTAIKISRYFYKKGKGIGFHREKLIDGKEPKSCPGTGISKGWFMGLIKADAVKEGWKKENEKWYFYQSGSKKTGWLKDKEVWYYLDAAGVMQTGWVKVAGKWYYLNPNGDMRVGWLRDKDKWYYLNPENGEMLTGDITMKGKPYSLRANGSLIITDKDGAITE